MLGRTEDANDAYKGLSLLSTDMASSMVDLKRRRRRGSSEAEIPRISTSVSPRTSNKSLMTGKTQCQEGVGLAGIVANLSLEDGSAQTGMEGQGYSNTDASPSVTQSGGRFRKKKLFFAMETEMGVTIGESSGALPALSAQSQPDASPRTQRRRPRSAVETVESNKRPKSAVEAVEFSKLRKWNVLLPPTADYLHGGDSPQSHPVPPPTPPSRSMSKGQFLGRRGCSPSPDVKDDDNESISPSRRTPMFNLSLPDAGRCAAAHSPGPEFSMPLEGLPALITTTPGETLFKGKPAPYFVINHGLLDDSQLWSYRRLQQLCGKLRISSCGKRTDLVERLHNFHRSRDEEGEKAEEEGCNLTLVPVKAEFIPVEYMTPVNCLHTVKSGGAIKSILKKRLMFREVVQRRRGNCVWSNTPEKQSNEGSSLATTGTATFETTFSKKIKFSPFNKVQLIASRMMINESMVTEVC